MSIPKEPRQLMINLMYLVLTAMLALNVSAEIINAFFMIDKGIKHSNEIVDHGVKSTIDGMQAVAEKKVHLQPLVDAAKQVPSMIEDLNSYIDSLRFLITYESGGVYVTEAAAQKWEDKGYLGSEGKLHMTEDEKMVGKPSGKKDKDTPQRVIVEQGRGEILKAKILETRKYLLAIVDSIQHTEIEGVMIDSAEIASLKSDLLLEGPNDEEWAAAGKPSWSAHIFGYMPVAACYPLFRKYQNDSKSSAAQIVNFLSGQMGKKELVYDNFDVFSSSPKPYILLGETFETEIALGAFSSQAEFSVRVGGSNLKIEEGKAKYTTKPTSIGEKTYSAQITVKNPLTGKEETFTKDFKYEVGQPSVNVSPDKMNVFYIGVPNPVTVAAAGIPTSAVKVSMVGGDMKKTSGTGYDVTCKKQGKATITVKDTKNGKSFPFEFRVKKIPDPKVTIAGKTDGIVKSGTFRAQKGLIPILENFDFEARCNIQSYTMYYTKKRADPIPVKGEGGRFSGQALSLIRQAKPGDTYQFYEVKARCPGDKAGRKVNPLSFQIK